jgi:hypothetical protein
LECVCIVCVRARNTKGTSSLIAPMFWFFILLIMIAMFSHLGTSSLRLLYMILHTGSLMNPNFSLNTAY